MSNVATQEQVGVKQFFENPAVKNKFNELLGKRSVSFVTSVLQVVSQNSLLANADPKSVYSAAAMAATLDLPINPNFGFAYIIPYNTRQRDGSFKQMAQFQVGYKGYIQLALRSGQFKSIEACRVYEGQLVEENPLRGNVYDWRAKKSDKVIGYVSYFQLLNGFEKYYYMTVEELQAHGKKYSKTYSKDSSKWKEDFDGMAMKTVIKLNISKYAPLSVEMQQMQQAIVADQAIINDVETMDVDYVDNEPDVRDPQVEQWVALINAAKTTKDLEKQYSDSMPDEVKAAYDKKWDELNA